MTLTAIVTNILSILTVLAEAIVILILKAKFFGKHKFSKKFMKLISKHALKIAFIAALIAMFGSLFYSEIAGYEPCKLCWYQRILMYPQVIILGIALWKKDNSAKNYIIPLSFIGIVIAFYHYLLQLGFVSLSSCSAIAGAVSCEKRYALTFGYITIPMMALSAFTLIFVMMLLTKQGKKSNKN